MQCPRTFYLLSSDIRSEGSTGIIKKFDFDFFWMVLDSIPFTHSKNVCVCVSVWPSPNIEPKPIDRSRSNSISGVLSQIYRAVFYFPPTPKIKSSSYKKNIKNLDFLKKWFQRFWLNFVDIEYIRNPTILHYRLFPEKTLKQDFFKFSIRFLMLHINQLINLAQIRYLGFSGKYL